MKLAIFSFLLIGAALAAPAEPSWKLNRRDGNDTNATVPSAGGLAGRGHAKLPVWKRFENNTASSQGNVARNENRTGMRSPLPPKPTACCQPTFPLL